MSQSGEGNASMRRLLVYFVMALAACAVFPLTTPSDVALAAGEDPVEAEAGHHEEGVPLGFKEDLAIWSLVVFIIFVSVLKKFAWGPLSEGLNKREQRIRQDIADAETARLKAEQMLREHQKKLDQVQDEVKEILAEARRDAEQAKQNILTVAQNEAETTKDRSIVEIERSRDQALKELFDAMAGQVATATEYVLGHGLQPEDQDRLIQEALAQLGNGAE